MDFGRVLEAILEGFWMPASMQKSIEFWMDSGRGSSMILASKTCPKSFQKLIWPNSKNLDFVWRVLQKWRYGALEIQPKCVQKLLRKFITFLMIFERLLASILHPKIIKQYIQNRIENWMIFLLIFGLILASFWEAKCFQNRIKKAMKFGVFFERVSESKMLPKREPQWS